VNVSATIEEVRRLDVTVDCANLARFLGNAEIGTGVFFLETGGRLSMIGVAMDHVDLVLFLSDPEIGEGVFVLETGGRFSMIGVAAKCCDACLHRVVGCSSSCLTTSIGCCNAILLRLVWLVPGWLRVMWFLF
jgi:hypothetical protein